MNISYAWLEEFCPSGRTPQEIRDLLTARAATVEELVPLRADLEPFVVARVVEAARHPDSERLSVTRVDDGSGTILDVVCGAPNVRAGGVYPFARTGTKMPNGMTIERRKIRGATSNGMLCSARELGLGEDQDGILELETDAAPGTPLLHVMQAGDVRLGLDVLPNRADLLSHLGVAREVSAATGVSLQLPAAGLTDLEVPAPVVDTVAATSGGGGATVRVDDPAGAPRYMAAVIGGVKVGPSPQWLVDRLTAIGSRSINNVVDVTNYMLHGFGQPMHAFDLARLGDRTIVVRHARAGEKLVTLDGVERTLDPSMTVIADATVAQAVAGVMGGRASEVTNETTELLLEVANFDPKSVRRTRRALGLSTDASYRFERGVDREATGEMLAYAVRLIVAVAGGTIEGPPIDVRQPQPARESIRLRPARVGQVLGVELEPVEIRRQLMSIGFDTLDEDGELRVLAPSWRGDIAGEIDLVEEVARLHGYDALPNEIRAYRPTNVPDDPRHVLARRVRDDLVAAGLFEIRPMAFVAGKDETHVRVTNPLAENEAHLRRSMLETLPRRAEHNLSHRSGDVRIFEIGSIFAPSSGRLPNEAFAVGALIMGRRRPPHFTEPEPPMFDEWDAKGLAERIAATAFPGAAVELRPGGTAPTGVVAQPLWEIVVNGNPSGFVGRLALDVPVSVNAGSAFGVELVLSPVGSADEAPRGQHDYLDPNVVRRAARSEPPRYTPLPTTPAAEFDLAFLVPDALAAGQVEEAIRKAAGELLERVELFDHYRGQGVPEGHRSLAWRLTFRDPTRTLRDKEVEGRRQRILQTLERELGVRQRT